MTSALKGLLLSGLVLPGCGQFVQKHYIRGTVLATAVLVAIAIITVKLSQQTFKVMERLQEQGGAPDLSSLFATTLDVVSASDNTLVNRCLVLVLVLWLVSMVDAYLSGKAIDARNASSSR